MFCSSNAKTKSILIFKNDEMADNKFTVLSKLPDFSKKK